ncbi:hypothetical protein Q31b_18720 [Novipirellula aureliae]|uniref:Uncharacterized protein n=1 Tax=Novipirellula aureliae TaxID=2527966 RepID=A0A5C6EA16_9BACT|nr:hypothetical protein Q31b_18720 [Novipirellula aureliae]
MRPVRILTTRVEALEWPNVPSEIIAYAPGTSPGEIENHLFRGIRGSVIDNDILEIEIAC